MKEKTRNTPMTHDSQNSSGSLLPLKNSVRFHPEESLNWNDWIKCKNWYDEFRKRNEGKFVFRGLSSSCYDIQSTFDRTYEGYIDKIELEPRWKYEAFMLLNFKRLAHQYIEASHIPQENDNLEWLSLLRHYGAPSRLVDFTYSFYTAVYFAMEGVKMNDAQDAAVVWAINIDWLKEKTKELLREKEKLLSIKGIKGRVFHDPDLFNEIIMNTNKKCDPLKDFVIPVNPFRRNRRIHLQQGLFLCPRNIEETFEKNLVGVPEIKNTKGKIDEGKIFKIKLKKDWKATVIKDLNQMNISWETLYGDLEGVARSLSDFFCLKYRLNIHPQFWDRAIFGIRDCCQRTKQQSGKILSVKNS